MAFIEAKGTHYDEERPVSVMIFGILNIGWAMLSLVGLLISSVMMAHMGASNPVVQQMHDNPTFAAWTNIMKPVGESCRWHFSPPALVC